MTLSTNGTERSSKRRKLTPPGEDQQHTAKVTKKTRPNISDSSTQHNGITTQMYDLSNEVALAKEELPSLKDLASSESALRRAVMKSIIQHLESRSPSSPLSSTECLQLWRGFWVAIYMHDSKNAVSVQNLIRDVAHTFAIIAAKDGNKAHETRTCTNGAKTESIQQTWLSTYHTAFHETLVREWSSIDQHRLNKFLLLARFAMRELFQICLSPVFKVSEKDQNVDVKTNKGSKGHSSREAAEVQASDPNLATSNTESIIQILETAGPLNPKERKIPDGLRLHILDLWNDELFGALHTLSEQSRSTIAAGESVEKSSMIATQAILEVLKKPLENMAKSDSGAQRHVRIRAKESLLDHEEREKGLLAE